LGLWDAMPTDEFRTLKRKDKAGKGSDKKFCWETSGGERGRSEV